MKRICFLTLCIMAISLPACKKKESIFTQEYYFGQTHLAVKFYLPLPGTSQDTVFLDTFLVTRRDDSVIF